MEQYNTTRMELNNYNAADPDYQVHVDIMVVDYKRMHESRIGGRMETGRFIIIVIMGNKNCAHTAAMAGPILCMRQMHKNCE
jgi:hypothetical protein